MINFPTLLFLITWAELAQIMGIISTIIFMIATITGVVWFIWKGKTLEQCKEDLKRAKEDVENYRKKNDELKAEKAEALAVKATVLAEKVELDKQLSEVEARLQRSLKREEDTEKENLRLKGELAGVTRRFNLEE